MPSPTSPSEPGAALRRGTLFVTACAGIFVFGIAYALLGALFGLPEMRHRLHINLAQQGDLLLVLFAGIFLATVVVGPLLDRFGSQPVMVIASVLVGVALAGFTVARSFPMAAAAALLLGLGGGGLNTSSNVLVSRLYGERRGPRLNILGIFFGFGALFMPLLAASISALLSVDQLLMVAASLAGACALGYAALRFPPAGEAHGFSWHEAAGVIRMPGVLLFGLLLFCESGDEASIGGWVSTYIGRAGSSARVATWILAGYWVALMLGRMLAARLLGRIAKGRLVLVGGIGGVAGAALLLVAPSVAVMAAATALLGLSYAPIYPTTLAMAGDRYPRFAGTVFGTLFSIALVGGGGFPWVVGQVSQSVGMRYGMLLPLAGAVAICLLSLRIAPGHANVAPGSTVSKGL
ncbi:MAG TPA: MFS transporter [Terriglobia bacterium]|nr:MFS transporter [Terriglobia bacterium]